MPGLDALGDLIDMCNSIIQPHFEYCSVFWGSFGFGLCEKIQKLHNRTARILFYASNEDDIEELLQALGWLSLLGCTKLDLD